MATRNRKVYRSYIIYARKWMGVEGLLLSGEVEETD